MSDIQHSNSQHNIVNRNAPCTTNVVLSIAILWVTLVGVAILLNVAMFGNVVMSVLKLSVSMSRIIILSISM